jgi:glycerol-3-phosphate dehydrogenase
VLIIGGGINGIGTFRDLALQGVDCLLIDRADFCSGASMASSHMLHGGIRYLENAEFRLVREALHERNNLLRNAPHLTHPLPTTIPIFKWFSGIFNAPLKFLGLLDRPAERGAVIIKLGLMMYDAYVRGDSPMPSHWVDGREAALARWPELNPEIRFAATYYDGGMHSPERLAVEILRDGAAEGDHARALNYVGAVDSEGRNVILRDEISGEKFAVQPQVVINAGGPWIDFINQRIDGETGLIGGTKGAHLILDHPELREALGDHEFFFEYFDGRIVLIYPYLDKVLLGTTDIRIENPDQVEVTEEEIDYILGMVPHIFPGLEVSQDQIIFQFTGVRPLPRAEGSTGQVSRDHSIEELGPGPDAPWPILNLVGGKWTSYRAFSEQVADRTLELLGETRTGSTAALPIGGGENYPADDQAREAWIAFQAEATSTPLERMKTLMTRYGTRAAEVAAASGAQDLPLDYAPEYTRDELTYLAEHEMITRLDDFFLRRSLTAWTGRVSPPLIEEAAEIIGLALGWDAARRENEVERCRTILQDEHALRWTPPGG